MLNRFKAALDPFLLILIGTVLFASFLPVRGEGARIAGIVADAGIVLLFFLHGAKLSREAILGGAKSWKLHAATLATTFLLFPLIGIGVSMLPIPPLVATGMLFLSLLPSTVQSSIAFTSIARGNVAAAVVSASFSNLLGIFLTPLLVALLMSRATQGAGGGISLAAVESIFLQLLLPFVAGHLMRPLIGGFVARHKTLVSRVDRASILMIVYTAFSAAVVEGLWHRVSGAELGLIAALSVVMLVLVLLVTWALGRLLGLPRADAIVLQFCGSKKSLASGVPMAGVLFPAAAVGPIILPLMLFHQIQLIACAILARHYGAREDEAVPVQAATAAR